MFFTDEVYAMLSTVRITTFVLVLGLSCVVVIGCSNEKNASNRATDMSAGSSGSAHAGSGGGIKDASRNDSASPAGDADLSVSGSDASGSGNADSGDADLVGDSGSAAQTPIDAPVSDDCITDVSAGDHTFTCSGSEITYMVMVDEKCTRFACGIIVDVHGAAMSGEIMRTDGQLHLLAPSKGYLTVHPTAPATTWDLEVDPPHMSDFISRLAKAFHADEKRIHMTGFSMGAAMTYWFLCNRNDMLASAAPVTGASADQTTLEGSATPCIASIDSSWQPRVSMLVMNGTQDNAFQIESARERVQGIVGRLGLTGGDVIDSGDGYNRKRWVGADAMVLDFLEHDYASSSDFLAGHCIPGGPDADAFACAGSKFKWGEVVLQWFIDHPKM
jgi:hypothetical protein